MQVTIEGTISADPRDRVLALEAVTQSICEQTGQDVAEGVMMLLTAAAHLTAKHSSRPVRETMTTLAESLGCAIVAADEFFKLREIVDAG